MGKSIGSSSIKVCKFGGTSMADAKAIKKVVEIVKADEERRYIIVSAPGRVRTGARIEKKENAKITDLLYGYFDAVSSGNSVADFAPIRDRFMDAAREIAPQFDMSELLDEVEEEIQKFGSRDFAASRGEYLSARLLSAAMGVPFVDAAELIKFDDDGNLLLSQSQAMIRTALEKVDRAVIPGFYGSMPDGRIKTFSRGGSDITGAIVSSAIFADMYENWTDVDGILSADPRIVHGAKPIENLSFGELRDLAYMGAEVLHPDSVFPVAEAGVPINVRNTFNPQNEGTIITAERLVARAPMRESLKNYVGGMNGQNIATHVRADEIAATSDAITTDGVNALEHPGTFTGITGKKGFALMTMYKSGMSGKTELIGRVVSALDKANIPIESLTTGIDKISVAIDSRFLKDKVHSGDLKALFDEMDVVDVIDNVALIAIVGVSRMDLNKVFSALRTQGIIPKLITNTVASNNIAIAVEEQGYERAINAIYSEFYA